MMRRFVRVVVGVPLVALLVLWSALDADESDNRPESPL